MLLIDLAAAFVAFLSAWALLPRLCALLCAGGLVRPNYQGKSVPVAIGAVLPLAALPGIIVWQVLGLSQWENGGRAALSLAVVLTGMAAAGLLDDTVGNGKQRGLKGHLRALMSGRLTTGGCKVLLGGAVALLVATTLPWRGFVYLATAGLLIAFSANLINLCDLRPGRALKVFSLTYLTIALIAGSYGNLLLIVPAIALALFPWDLQARAMMGDTGANALGGTLGLFVVQELPLGGQVAFLAFLLAAHVLTERWSLSELINNVPVLRWFDMLGRKG